MGAIETDGRFNAIFNPPQPHFETGNLRCLPSSLLPIQHKDMRSMFL
jgi:hypothetical protein